MFSVYSKEREGQNTRERMSGRAINPGAGCQDARILGCLDGRMASCCLRTCSVCAAMKFLIDARK